MERRSSGSSAWQLVWKMDVVSRSEEMIRVNPAADGQSELELWTYALPDGSIAVDSDFSLANAGPLHASSSVLHQNSNPLMVTTLRSGQTEYRVFQAVAVLDGEVI